MKISKYFSLPLLFCILILSFTSVAQTANTGIGTTNPEAKLHVNGDLKLQSGSAVNKFSRDSTFSENSHSNIPTEKAIKDFIQKGIWAGADLSVPGPQAPLARSFAVLDADNAVAIATKGYSAFVVSPTINQLQIIDFSNPDALVRKGSISTNLDLPTSVYVQGNYAYVTSAQNNRLCIYDISNENSIVAKGFTNVTLAFPRSVVVQGNYAYVASDDAARISCFDISNPDNIVFRAIGGVALSAPISMDIQGNFLYVTSYSASELQIYDITVPTSITYKTFTTSNLSGPRSVDVSGSYAYVASRENNRLCVFDISNPNSIVPRASSSANLNHPNSVKVLNGYVFVSSEGNGRICMFDARNPAVVLDRGYNTALLSQPMAVAISNNLICVANQGNNRNLCIYDLDPAKSIQLTADGFKAIPDTWKTEGNNVFRLNGNVGIKKQIPVYDLDVDGDIAATGVLISSSATTNALTTNTIAVNNNASFANILGNKLKLFQASTGYVGAGVYNNEFRFHTDYAGADITFGFLQNNEAFTERMRIKGNGNVGIGVSNPSVALSFPALLGKKISLYPGATGDVGMAVEGNDFRIYTDNNVAKVSIGYTQYAGNFYQNNLDIYANGNAWLRGTLTQASDSRLKKNILPLRGSLHRIQQLTGYQYNWIDSARDSTVQLGLLAQEVKLFFPELVKENDKGELSVNYAGLIPVLIEGLKELNKEKDHKIAEQEARIRKLEMQLEQLLKSVQR